MGYDIIMNRADGRRLKRNAIAKKMRASQTGRRLLEEAPVVRNIDIPDELRAAVARTERSASEGTLPLTVLKSPDEPVGDALVVIKLSSWLQHVGQQITAAVGNATAQEAPEASGAGGDEEESGGS